ncbi:hypothetical protein PIB30_072588, partial [Stylosanthes scabra]|nr:hypothetical protein [Stylosanthes scabra]
IRSEMLEVARHNDLEEEQRWRVDQWWKKKKKKKKKNGRNTVVVEMVEMHRKDRRWKG